MYTTVTQKQSFDSMTVSQYQSVKLPAHNSMKLNANAMHSGHGHLMMPHGHIDDMANHTVESFAKRTATPTVTNDADVYSHTDFMHDKVNEIRISISCGNKIKVEKPSRFTQMFTNVFGWRQSIRNIGYYSPPMEHPIDKISIRLNTRPNDTNDDPNAQQSMAADNNNKSRGHVQFAPNPFRRSGIEISDDESDVNDNEDDDIGGRRGNDGGVQAADSSSNNSLTNDNANTLDDELSTYMNELRLRELR